MDQADIKLVGAIEAHLEAKDARIAELERALRAAHQYMMPSVNRGPAYASWCMAIEMVEPLIGESEGRSLIAQCGL